MNRALLIDAGNSRIKWALAQDGAIVSDGAFAHAETAVRHTALEALPKPAAAWISNVAGPDAAARLESLIDTAWPGLVRHWVRAQDWQGGVTNGYAEPSQLGSDRWCGMIGAHAAYPGENLLIATLGTATTIEALRADGRFVGGLIAPGWSLMMESLGQHTAQLPSLDAAAAQRTLRSRQPGGPHGHAASNAGLDSTDGSATGEHLDGTFACDTRGALSEGCRIAQAAFIDYAYRDAVALFGAPVRCILGGGAADAIGPVLRVPFTRHDGLVLAGLARIAADWNGTASEREPREN